MLGLWTQQVNNWNFHFLCFCYFNNMFDKTWRSEFTWYIHMYSLFIVVYIVESPPAPPTPTNITTQFMNSSSVRVAWQWTSSGPAPNCFNTTTVTYHPEGGSESSLHLSDPAATEATLTDLQCNTSYTIAVVTTAGEHKTEGVAPFSTLQGTHKMFSYLHGSL